MVYAVPELSMDAQSKCKQVVTGSLVEEMVGQLVMKRINLQMDSRVKWTVNIPVLLQSMYCNIIEHESYRNAAMCNTVQGYLQLTLVSGILTLN